jgi:hypothetical protein
MSDTSDLETLVQNAIAALADPEADAPAPLETTMRERFYELITLILGNLYNKTPVAAALFDRGTMLRVTSGMDDVDAGKLTGRGEDWLRLENILRQQDGQKAYFLNKQSLAILSTLTSQGTLGDVMDKVLRRYVESMPTPRIRTATRMLATYFLMRIGQD